MKLKLVVAMSVLGLVTCPASFADTQTKQKMHHKVKHHRVVSTKDYKDTGVLPIVTECQTDWYQPMMDSMNQNMGRARPTVDCSKPLTFAGGIAADYHFGNLSQGYTTENTDKFTLNDAYINAFGNVNSWAKAFASLSYNNTSRGNVNGNGNGSTNGVRNSVLNGQYSAAYNTPNTLNLEQGFVTLGDLNEYPVFLQVGKQFADYGRYQLHPLTRSLTQSLTETLRTSVDLGFVTHMGFNGSLYVYDNGLRKSTSTGVLTGDAHSRNAYGASLGYAQMSDQLGYRLGVGYVTDMIGANDVQNAVTNYHTASGNGYGSTFINHVGAVALYGDVNSGPFSVGVRYSTALQSFSYLDMPNNLVGAATATAQGAKPWAADINAGYGFNAWSHDQNVYVGYQQTGAATYMALPANRWLAGYGVTVMKNTNVGVELDHDNAYSQTKGGTGNSSNLVGVRISTMFG